MAKAALGPIGVVIPGYGHPQFLAEAIISACEQEIDRKLYVVVVDDGCKFPETGQMVEQLMREYPGVLHYLRQKNTRLPGARNTGIRFLLQLDPELDSIYFLDADNRIAPYSLKTFRQALGDDPAIGWAYPDISMFGLSRNEDGFDTRETAPEYSKLKHLIGNISEAGSLVRADVFRAGVFYDEEMTSGFEDWDFWLGALEAGYVGTRALNSGFLYRRRPESMLADSRRLEETLIARIRESHKSLFSPAAVMALEQSEAPVFAFFVEGSDQVLLSSDLKAPQKPMSLASFRALTHRWLLDSRETFFPQHLIYLGTKEWEQLHSMPHYVRWMLWKVRDNAQGYSHIHVEKSDTFGVTIHPGMTSGSAGQPLAVSIRAGLMKKWLEASKEQGSLTGPSDLGTPQGILFELPDPAEAVVNDATKAPDQRATHNDCYMVPFIENTMQQLLPVDQVTRHQSRRYAGPSCLDVRKSLIREICAAEEREPFAAVTGKSRTLVFVAAEMLQFEKAAEKFGVLLAGLKNAGSETMVVVELEPKQQLSDMSFQWAEWADDIVPMPLSGGQIEYRIYLGRRVSHKLALVAKVDVMLLARSCDTLVSCGAAAGLEALGEAKSHGAVGYVWLEDTFLNGDMLAQQAKILAYEHAISRVITDDEDMLHALSAEGMPPSKFQDVESFWATQSK